MDYPSDDEVIAISYLQEIEAKLKIQSKNKNKKRKVLNHDHTNKLDNNK